MKLKIPVVSTNFLFECDKQQKYLEPDLFLIAGKSASDVFSSGKIVAKRMRVENNPSSSTSTIPKRFKSLIQLKDVKFWQTQDPQLPPFPQDLFEIAKNVIFLKEESNSKRSTYSIIELHVSQAQINTFPFRIHFERGVIEEHGNPIEKTTEYSYFSSVWDAEEIYSQLHQEQIKKGLNKSQRNPKLNIGSQKFIQETQSLNGATLSPEVNELIEEIFAEADAEFASIMSDEYGIPPVIKIEEGEGKSLSFFFFFFFFFFF